MTKPGEVRAIIIGAGMSGIMAAIKLREAGVAVSVHEKADKVGGTWRDNSYPGLSCDVPSHAYSYSFALNPDWSCHYAPGQEIQAYFESVAKQFEIVDLIRFGSQVTDAVWVDDHWQITTADGFSDEAEIIIAATGVLHHPNMAKIPGLDDFAGKSFHSARWDHNAQTAAQRVGVIGTGSTAVQITSALADEAEHFSLFQRTAQWVMPLPNPSYDQQEQDRLRSNPHAHARLHRYLNDSMTVRLSNHLINADSEVMAEVEAQCEANLNTVVDPDLRQRLRPDYRAACKRLVVSPDFYDKVQRPNVELVTSAIAKIEPEGVRTVDGKLHNLDVLVLATGFKVDSFVRPMNVVGLDGHTLDEMWDPRPVAYLAIGVPQVPNFFMLNGPNGPVGNFSLIEIAEQQMGYIMGLVDEIVSGRCQAIAPSGDATEAYESERAEACTNTIWMTGCRSWYLDDRGIPATWPWTFDRFNAEMSAPNLDHYTTR